MNFRVYFVLWTLSFVPVKGQDPEIVDEISPDVQPLGGTAHLNCTVTNKNTSMVTWEHVDSGEQLSSDTDLEVQVNPTVEGLSKYDVEYSESGDRETYTLIVRRLREYDAGTYRCTIRIQNVSFDQWPSKLGMIAVKVPPTIRLGDSTKRIEMDQGESASLTCVAFGVPSPNITWTRADGSNLPGGHAQFRSSKLPLTNVTVEDGGTYRCVADNNIKPPAQHLAQVFIFHTPTTRAVQDTVGQAQNRRYDATLDCIVEGGYPEPTVTWERLTSQGRVQITNDDKYDIKKQTTGNENLKAGEEWYTLKVMNVQANDYTDYYCVAINSKGRHESNFTLLEIVYTTTSALNTTATSTVSATSDDNDSTMSSTISSITVTTTPSTSSSANSQLKENSNFRLEITAIVCSCVATFTSLVLAVACL